MKTIFEWDKFKARINFEKHKISFEEASTIFADPSLVTFVDDFHSNKEERFIKHWTFCKKSGFACCSHGT